LASSRRLKIALFSDSLLPVNNGVSVSIATLVESLRRQGHEVHLYAPAYPGHEDAAESQTVRLPSIRLPWADGYPIAVPPVFHLVGHFRREQYDLVHTHTIGIAGYVGLKWAKAHELPLVATYHTLYDRYAHYCTVLPRRYVRYKIARHTQLFFNQADAILTPSPLSKRWLNRHRVTPPIHVVPTGIPRVEPIAASFARRELGLNSAGPVLLTVGRLVAEKNLQTVIRAFAKLGCNTAELCIVGDGPYRSELRNLARALGVDTRVKFAGCVRPDQIGPYYAAADLFVFASTTETQGLVVQEAMAHRVPAILVEGGGASYAARNGETAIICRNTPENLAEAIGAALDHPVRLARIALTAQENVRRNHSPEKMTEDVLAVYASVLPSERAVFHRRSV
jgi:glycosyltransferase involved in cell wall biosynthesis